MTLLALAPVPFAAAATIILGGKVQQRFGKVQKLFSGLSGFVNESIAGIKVTKAFAKEVYGVIVDDSKEKFVPDVEASEKLRAAMKAAR